jgi:hypothetical protein
VKHARFLNLPWGIAAALAVLLLAVTSTSSLAVAPPTAREYRRSGYLAPSAPAYPQLAGRALSPGFSIATDATLERYWIFQRAAQRREVVAARLNLLSRSGSAGSAVLTLEVYSDGGQYRRTLSASPVNLLTAAAGEWTALDLAGRRDCNLDPDEYLAAHVAVTSGVSFTIQPILDVALDQGVYFIDIPFLRK